MVSEMQYIPWQNVADWHCKACGYCCKLYSVVLHYPEYLNLTKTFGAQVTVTDFKRFYIRRHSDGTCVFLCSRNLNHYCGLQSMKPDACRIWPFKVLAEPKYGEAKQAEYKYGERTFYVYVDSICSGVSYGVPTWDFQNGTVKEFTELALGVRDVQHNSTRRVSVQFGRQLFP